jgi:hypothetical protein
MIVFAIDPPGQGEHVQYYDTSVKFSSVGYTVIEHCYFGNQGFLSGISSARFFIWDGIRAIDYLISRKEVDASKIGVTGFSGGWYHYFLHWCCLTSVYLLLFHAVGQMLPGDTLKPRDRWMRNQY